MAGWLWEKAGRECSCRRFHSGAGREGLGALLGRAGGDNFRWNHAGVNGTLSLIAVCLICLIMLKKSGDNHSPLLTKTEIQVVWVFFGFLDVVMTSTPVPQTVTHVARAGVL